MGLNRRVAIAFVTAADPISLYLNEKRIFAAQTNGVVGLALLVLVGPDISTDRGMSAGVLFAYARVFVANV